MIPSVGYDDDFVFRNPVPVSDSFLAEFRDCKNFFCVMCNVPVGKSAVKFYKFVFESSKVLWMIFCVDIMNEGKTAKLSKRGSVGKIQTCGFCFSAGLCKSSHIPERKPVDFLRGIDELYVFILRNCLCILWNKN